MKIEALNLSTRSHNCLKRNCINTVEQLMDKSREDLMNIPGVGFGTASEIIARLKAVKMTNADRIRSMSDEELAVWLATHDIAVHFCENAPHCADDLEHDRVIPDERCAACALAWLRKPTDPEK